MSPPDPNAPATRITALPSFLKRAVRDTARLHPLRWSSLALYYAATAATTLWLSYALRFDFEIPAEFHRSLLNTLVWAVPLKLIVLALCGQFHDSLSYFSTPDIRRVLLSSVIGSLLLATGYQILGVTMAPPRGVILIDLLLSSAVLCGGRTLLRYMREHFLAPNTRPTTDGRRVAIIGCDATGAGLCRELLGSPWLGLRPVAFFDDHHRPSARVHGIPVRGRPADLADEKMKLMFDEVIIALPNAPGWRVREIVHMLQKTHLPFRTIPSMTQLAMGTVNVTKLRPVQIEDLLNRDVIEIDAEHIREMIEGRTVLVSGAGGSIGSELCRQIVSFSPRKLVMLERSEPALFPIEQELVARGARDRIVPLVADILDTGRLVGIFAEHQPEAVFHAAAHKHVPLMESQPAEAIRNNVLGTVQLAETAAAFGTEHFLLISTDKAINPTSVMGATKRMAEIAVQSMYQRPGCETKFSAVRFGNVLGSSGSVVPIFERQIAAGGPVKVTHPDVTRYFMTIPEAVSLVLQSASRAHGGDIFVLDMGEPVKIVDLARQMIELSGLRPDVDVKIEFTGLRPGEKLFEELSHAGENIAPTDHHKIRRFICTPMQESEVKPFLSELAQSLGTFEAEALKQMLKRMIVEYNPGSTAGHALEGTSQLSAARGVDRQAVPVP